MLRRCGESNKIRYSEAGANAAMANIKHQVSKYRCEDCGDYHLTDSRNSMKPYRRHGRRLKEWRSVGEWGVGDV